MELRINPDGTLRYDGDFGRYVIRGDVLIIRIPDDSPERFRFSLRGDRLLLWETPHDDPIVLSRVGGSPRLRKAEAPKASGSSQQTGAPGGRSSADLQRSVQKPSGRSGAASSLPGGTRNVSPSPPSDEKQEGASGGPTSLPKTARVPGKRQAPGGEIFKSADGTLSFRLPQGWSAQEMNTRDFQGIVLNPGLKPGGILEARIVLSRQRVQCSDLRLGLARMAQSAIQDLLKQAPHLRPDGSPSIHPAGGGGGGGGTAHGDPQRAPARRRTAHPRVDRRGGQAPLQFSADRADHGRSLGALPAPPRIGFRLSPDPRPGAQPPAGASLGGSVERDLRKNGRIGKQLQGNAP